MRRQRFNILILLLCFGFVAAAQDTSGVAMAEQDITVREEILNSNKIELYPNPAVDFLIVQISNSSLENAKFEIRSLLGTQMTVTSEDLGGGRYRFPVKDFSTGYYFVVVEDEKQRFKKAFRFLKN